MNKKWRIKKFNPILQKILSQQLGISSTTAQVLLNRGIYTVEEASKFLYADLSSIADPFLLKDMDRAVERILLALKRKEKILIYGDYDTDGITGTAILVKVLKKLKAQVDYYIPHRLKEGYGLNIRAVQQAKEKGFKLIITVDCGINDHEAVIWAKSTGTPDIIITDHHNPSSDLPPALAVINPKRIGCSYPFKELAGAGVALKLAQALTRDWQDYLELACLGTVADVVPLLGENRILVKHGLLQLGCTTNIGLKALKNIITIKGNEFNTRDISFGLAPHLNAAGRMGDARQAVELLLCDDPTQANIIAEQLEKTNQQRQKVESQVFDQALKIIESNPQLISSKVIVLTSHGWHPGVIGIVASRLVEIFYRPVLLIAIEEDKGKGSGRSIPGFHLYEALYNCREYLLSFGGHAQAAGFSIKINQLNYLSQKLNEYFLKDGLPVPLMELEGLVSLTQVTEKLVRELKMLSPFGQGNPEPVFCCSRVKILQLREVGQKGNHLKLLVEKNGTKYSCIGFNMVNLPVEFNDSATVDLAFIPVLDHWNGQTRVQLELKDIKKTANVTLEKLNYQDAYFKSTIEVLKENKMYLPDFIFFWLKKYRQLPGSIFLADWLNYPNDLAYTIKPPQIKSLIDMRNIYSKSSELANLVLREKSTVVVVNCPYQTIEMVAYLRQAGYDKVSFIHNQLSKKETENILYSFTKGEIKTLVITTSFIPLLQNTGIEQLITYHLPYNKEEWLLILTIPAEKIYLLFCQEDKKTMELYLTSLAPDRDCLARLYVTMRKLILNNKNIKNTQLLRLLTGILQNSGLKWLGEHTVCIALAVFYELGLIEIKHNIRLAPLPEEKLHLENSPTYSWGQKIKKNSLAWQEKALNASLKEREWWFNTKDNLQYNKYIAFLKVSNHAAGTSP